MRPQFQYPALYQTASDMSSDAQNLHLRLIRVEYSLLVIAAVLSMNFSTSPIYFAFTTFVLILSLTVLIVRNWWKPEQDWYRGRALAESIKTSCWKYCMRAEPFGDADKVAVRRAEFRDYLLGILRANRHIGDRMPPDHAAQDQITRSMEDTRALSLDDRKAVYDKHRIREQRNWYAVKAGKNKRASRGWLSFGVAAYATAIALSVGRVVYPHISFWPIEPVIVVASSVIGWVQIKKFNELASSYTLTAHEIGILQSRVMEVANEDEFSRFVRDAEQAFSREHTQWVARQEQA